MGPVNVYTFTRDGYLANVNLFAALMLIKKLVKTINSDDGTVSYKFTNIASMFVGPFFSNYQLINDFEVRTEIYVVDQFFRISRMNL